MTICPSRGLYVEPATKIREQRDALLEIVQELDDWYDGGRVGDAERSIPGPYSAGLFGDGEETWRDTVRRVLREVNR